MQKKRPESTRASDNSGSVAQARFFYQHEYIAYWCIQMLINDKIEYIVCEHHEDFYICWEDGHYDFLQVKTRTEGQGEWTLANLLEKKKGSSSILQKLYEKHRDFGNGLSNKYVFVSNMGAGEPKKPNLKTLKNLNEQGYKNWNDEDKKMFEQIFNSIKDKINHDDETFFINFCLSLDIQTRQPSPEYIAIFNHEKLQEALKQSQGIDFVLPDIKKFYEGILRIVRDANIIEDDANQEKMIAQKTIHSQQIKKLIDTSSSVSYLERVERLPVDDKIPIELTKLQEKTQAVKWDPDIITYLMDMRASTNLFYRKHSSLRQFKKRLQDLSHQVQRICIRVKTESKIDNLNGVQQWLLLNKYLEELADKDKNQGHKPEIGIDYLFGVAGELTCKCKIRWSYDDAI